MTYGKSPYKNYQRALNTLKDPEALTRWPLICLRGDSDFLLIQTKRFLKSLWKDSKWTIDEYDGATLNHEKLLQLVSVKSLFEPKLLALINDADKMEDAISLLRIIPSKEKIQNPIIFFWMGRELGSKLSQEFKRLDCLEIPCDAPASWEIKDFAKDRSKSLGLALNQEALLALIEATGNEPFKIENELVTLSLAFANATTPFNANDISKHLTYLKKDHIFKLDQYLCQEAFDKAFLMITDLVSRGENPLGILAILGMHCRKSLQIKSALKDGLDISEISRLTRLPTFVTKTFIPYVKRRKNSTFEKTLNLCHEVDYRLKNSRIEEELYLAEIIFSLR